MGQNPEPKQGEGTREAGADGRDETALTSVELPTELAAPLAGELEVPPEAAGARPEQSGDGNGVKVGGPAAPGRRAELTERAEAYARGSRADSTWAAYERRWARFERWCAQAGEQALPAQGLTVARFLVDLAPTWRPATPADAAAGRDVVEGQVCEQPGLRPGTLEGYLAAIAVAHHSAELEDPVRSETVRRTMAGIRRHPGVPPPQRRAAARRDPLITILGQLRPAQHLADARDHALLLIGWKAALRTDDLARLRMDDLLASEHGLQVHIRRSKTDQTGQGHTLGIAAPCARPTATRPTPSHADDGHDGNGGHDGELGAAVLLDAGAAWARWRTLLGAYGVTDGPAWRGVDRHGRLRLRGGLHRNTIAEIIKRRATQAGLDDAARWGGHSLRRGFATEAIAAGVPDRDVQRHGRWRSRTSMDPYIDAARTFDPTNPTHWLG